MNQEFESAARWHATKVVIVLFSIIGAFVSIAYVGIFWLFVVVASMFAIMIAGALYSDAYYTKLLELKKNDQSRTN
jgi:hypothetical protein